MEPNSRAFYKQCAFQKFCNVKEHEQEFIETANECSAKAVQKTVTIHSRFDGTTNKAEL